MNGRKRFCGWRSKITRMTGCRLRGNDTWLVNFRSATVYRMAALPKAKIIVKSEVSQQALKPFFLHRFTTPTPRLFSFTGVVKIREEKAAKNKPNLDYLATRICLQQGFPWRSLFTLCGQTFDTTNEGFCEF